ncbi:hypothetical protein GOP47_0019752, partial [Adiantum capillus-veneris]
YPSRGGMAASRGLSVILPPNLKFVDKLHPPNVGHSSHLPRCQLVTRGGESKQRKARMHAKGEVTHVGDWRR